MLFIVIILIMSAQSLLSSFICGMFYTLANMNKGVEHRDSLTKLGNMFAWGFCICIIGTIGFIIASDIEVVDKFWGIILLLIASVMALFVGRRYRLWVISKYCGIGEPHNRLLRSLSIDMILFVFVITVYTITIVGV